MDKEKWWKVNQLKLKNMNKVIGSGEYWNDFYVQNSMRGYKIQIKKSHRFTFNTSFSGFKARDSSEQKNRGERYLHRIETLRKFLLKQSSSLHTKSMWRNFASSTAYCQQNQTPISWNTFRKEKTFYITARHLYRKVELGAFIVSRI